MKKKRIAALLLTAFLIVNEAVYPVDQYVTYAQSEPEEELSLEEGETEEPLALQDRRIEQEGEQQREGQHDRHLDEIQKKLRKQGRVYQRKMGQFCLKIRILCLMIKVC